MLFYVALGSAIGGVGRYVLGGLVQRLVDTSFPVGTLLVNISGSLLLGILAGYALVAPALSAEVRAFLTVGICGGYTTFSTFSYDTVRLLERNAWIEAGLYVAASVLLSVLATFLGFTLARQALVGNSVG